MISQIKNDTRIDLITSIYSVYWNTGGSRLVEEYGRSGKVDDACTVYV